MNMTRSRALALLGAPLAVASCGVHFPIRVGSKNFTESIVIAEIYAQALEAAHLRVQRRFNLGSTQIALAAMSRGEVDLYPEYTGTALIDVLHQNPVQDPKKAFAIVRAAFAQRRGMSWLDPAPMSDSQGLATTRAVAAKYHLRTLSELSRVSAQLRLATIPEFVSRPDGLPGLARVYDGMAFASVKTYDIALKYQALVEGKADVATAFTTDGAIATSQLVVLEDDRHLWPPYNVAPVVRSTVLAQFPDIASVLNAVSPAITDRTAQDMNARVESGADPADVASAFLRNVRR
jgi:osmoprotectant transport system substrate-binding protein